MKKILLFASALFSAMLMQSQAQTVLFEDFESGALPAGWVQGATLASDGGWKFGINTALQSQSFQIPAHTKMAGTNDDGCNCNKSADTLKSPSMSFTGLSNVFLSVDAFYYSATYNGSKESFKLIASTNGGQSWTFVDSLDGNATWATSILDLSAYANQANVNLAFVYSDRGGYLYGAVIDNFKVYVPDAYDIATKTVQLETYFAAATVPITGSVFNYGASTITTIDLNYKVDNGSVVTQNVNVSIPPLTSYNYTHPTNWNAPGGVHSVKVWASNLNGNADMNAANDTVSTMVSVLATPVTRTVLFEQFTSSTCNPCAAANPGFNALLDANQNTTAAIKYQMNYPAPGTDPCYIASEGGTRASYYGVNGIPHFQMDGKTLGDHPANMTQGILDAELLKTAVYDINIKWSVVGSNKVFVDVTTTTKGDILPTSSMKLHVVAIENSVDHAAQTNGETTFFDVDRKMIPGAAGASMQNQQANQTFNYTGNWTIANVAGAPVDPTDINIVAFVQDNASGKVLQSAISMTPNAIRDVNGNEQIVSVYPNPFNNTTKVNFSLTSTVEVKVEVFNLVGEKVYSVNKGELNAGSHSVIIDGASLSSGMYFVNVIAGERTYTQKVTLNK
jgi:hypothetical protein